MFPRGMRPAFVRGARELNERRELVPRTRATAIERRAAEARRGEEEEEEKRKELERKSAPTRFRQPSAAGATELLACCASGRRIHLFSVWR